MGRKPDLPDWLEKQPERSVIYVAFGSKAMFSHEQFEELAHGLEMVGQLFLWVVRSDTINNGSVVKYPDGFCERVMDRGKMVNWAPQEMVLAHPSIAYFLIHCGWNSSMEGNSFGVPFLCWPYFGDQFHIRSYICDVLEENALKLKEMAEKTVSEGGSSLKYLKSFVEELRS
ncbi:hypothetical protein FNV43_RR20859 [Rhamnella rubrinervis]|uniref:Uncharacterized protein n=1 Tax=Rhamnella rubrinervis TaxID=2594499 RepID=A0A8K0GUY4_9ROSA|nr:hypothetical protein FNV43_RR20859 [Rhamnella rubrinervis]